MHIVIAPDSFKETLSAQQVAEIIAEGFRDVFPTARYTLLPLADGGEGTVDALVYALSGSYRQSIVLDPLGREISAKWGLIDQGKTAVIELAAASGLPLLNHKERNPAITSTFGTGMLILEALDLGVEKIILGLGGSATNDAGAGILSALGFGLLDSNHQVLAQGGLALQQFTHFELTNIHSRLNQVELVIACDVKNPLTGQNGASYIFGPQKGGNKHSLSVLDNALTHFAQSTRCYFPLVDPNDEGMGAAGGASFGLSIAFPQRQIVSGIGLILEHLEVAKHLSDADLLITGEGKMDNQTLNGKTPFGVAHLANQFNVPTIAICGVLGDEIDQLNSYFHAIFPSIRAISTLEDTLHEAEANLFRTAKNVARCCNLKF